MFGAGRETTDGRLKANDGRRNRPSFFLVYPPLAEATADSPCFCGQEIC